MMRVHPEGADSELGDHSMQFHPLQGNPTQQTGNNASSSNSNLPVSSAAGNASRPRAGGSVSFMNSAGTEALLSGEAVDKAKDAAKGAAANAARAGLDKAAAAGEQMGAAALEKAGSKLTGWLSSNVSKHVGGGGALAVETAAESAKKVAKLAGNLQKLASRQTTVKTSLLIKLTVFIGLNASLMVYLFVLARFVFRYSSADVASTQDGTQYVTQGGRLTPANIPLVTDDYEVPYAGNNLHPTAHSSSSSSSLHYMVNMPFDGHGHPGWNIYDIMDQLRVSDTHHDAYTDPVSGKRMIQNYNLCKANCLVNGRPYDLVNAAVIHAGRDFAVMPYGQWNDFYVSRDLFLSTLDPDYYATYIDPYSVRVRGLYNNWGVHKAFQDNPVNMTQATEKKHLCNVGIPRRRLTSITIQATACHVQVVPVSGNQYTVYHQAGQMNSGTLEIYEEQSINVTSGCLSYSLVVAVNSTKCPSSLIPGEVPSCEDTCSLVLMKGVYARPIPIVVVANVDPAVDQSTLHIDDKFLVLDTRHPWEQVPSGPDLIVKGGRINVALSNARVGDVDVNTAGGSVNVANVRLDRAYFNTSDDNAVIQDSRDTELLYRSPGNLLCAAAPLIEEIPTDFLQCDMAPPQSPTLAVHNWYETTVDGVIDRNEFMDGLARMGLDFGTDSLNLNSEEQALLMAHVFKSVDTSSTTRTLSITDFIRRMRVILPPLTSLYDHARSKPDCLAGCYAAGNYTQAQCKQLCLWSCDSHYINVSEPVFGYCDPNNGCQRDCGTPDWPITRYSTASSELDQQYSLTLPYDFNDDGYLTPEEVRAGLLYYLSNCTYEVATTVVGIPNYCSLTGRGQYSMDSASLTRVCSTASVGNPYDWRYNNSNMPKAPLLVNGTSPYHGVIPRECRPFPDYDPKLSGRVYDPHVTREECPECFLSDGSRAPPHYYNRSTWSTKRYDEVMTALKMVIRPSDIPGNYFPYFNISDDSHFKTFIDYMLAPFGSQESVDYYSFDYNLQTLDQLPFLGPRKMLFNPNCYNGRLLKLRPNYVSGAEEGVNRAAINAAAVQYRHDGSYLIDDTMMPGFPKSNDPSVVSVGACPVSWGNGTQGSTTFSYFAWASVERGYKWGQALPSFCMDEAFPSGGVWNGTHGLYPDMPHIYGQLAGRPVLPGCVPAVCKPTFKISVAQGSIHVQVLPFTFDAWNATGQYQTMIDSCNGDDGQPRCFYKGYDSAMDVRMVPNDLITYQAAFQPCVDGSAVCSDQLFIMNVQGQGVPTHQKWFWTSRKVYMEVEPPYFLLMSAGVLGADVRNLPLRLSPGFCEARHGAVDGSDWRDYRTVGTNSDVEVAVRELRNAQVFTTLNKALPSVSSSSTTSTTSSSSSSSSSSTSSTSGEPQSQTAQKQEAQSSESALPANSGWYVKMVWRNPYTNESLYFDPTTADGTSDTSPGLLMEDGSVVEQGQWWRHKRLCLDDANCATSNIIYRDNCLIPRTVQWVPQSSSNGTLVANLSVCTFPDGASAYTVPSMGEDAPTINETAYYNQFARNLSSYTWFGWGDSAGAEDHLVRNFITYRGGHGSDNITSFFFSKYKVAFGKDSQIEFVSAENAGSEDIALFLAIVFSLVIAIVCGLGVLIAMVFFGLRYLANVTKTLEAREKAEKARVDERVEQLYEMIKEAKKQKILSAKEKEKKKGEAEGPKEGPTVPNSPTERDPDGEGQDDVVDQEEAQDEADAEEAENALVVELGPAEKQEILWIMAENQYTLQNVKKWNLENMVDCWKKECKVRKKKLKELPAEDRFTMLPTNRPEEEHTEMITALKSVTGKFTSLNKEVAMVNVPSPFAVAAARPVAVAAAATAAAQAAVSNAAAVAQSAASSAAAVAHAAANNAAATAQAAVGGAAAAVAAAVGAPETQPLLNKPPPKKVLTFRDEEFWQKKMLGANPVAKLAIVNILRAWRAVRMLAAILLHNFPSPFEVLDAAVMSRVRQKVLNSLQTFLKVKCMMDHHLKANEEIILGKIPHKKYKNLQRKTRNLREKGLKGVDAILDEYAEKKRKKNKKRADKQEKKKPKKQQEDDEDEIEEEEHARIVVDSLPDHPIIALSADFKTELYAVEFVRIYVRAIPLQHEEEEDDVVDELLSTRDESAALLPEGPGQGHGRKLASTGVKAVKKGFNLINGLYKFVARMVEKFIDALDGDSNEDDEDENAYEVIVQEGCGWSISPDYDPKEDETSTMAKVGRMPNASDRVWEWRQLRMPCPAIQQALQHRQQVNGKAALHAALTGMLRQYVIQESNGPSVVRINTDVGLDGKDPTEIEPDELRPVVEFGTSRRGFNTIYERWCHQNHLRFHDVLEEEAFLADLKIKIRKKVVPRIKGLKLHGTNNITVLEEMDREEQTRLLEEAELQHQEDLQAQQEALQSDALPAFDGDIPLLATPPTANLSRGFEAEADADPSPLLPMLSMGSHANLSAAAGEIEAATDDAAGAVERSGSGSSQRSAALLVVGSPDDEADASRQASLAAQGSLPTQASLPGEITSPGAVPSAQLPPRAPVRSASGAAKISGTSATVTPGASSTAAATPASEQAGGASAGGTSKSTSLARPSTNQASKRPGTSNKLFRMAAGAQDKGNPGGNMSRAMSKALASRAGSFQELDNAAGASSGKPDQADKPGEQSGSKEAAPAAASAKADTGKDATSGIAAVGPQKEANHNQRMFEALLCSTEPLAVFLKETCALTANFSVDSVDLQVLIPYYKMWLRHKMARAEREAQAAAHVAQLAAQRAAAAGPARAPAELSLAELSPGPLAGDAGAEVDPDSTTDSEFRSMIRDMNTALGGTMQRMAGLGGPRPADDNVSAADPLRASYDYGLAGSLSAPLNVPSFNNTMEPVHYAAAAAVGAAGAGGDGGEGGEKLVGGLPEATMNAILGMDPSKVLIMPEEVDRFGLRCVEEDVYEMDGVMVNMKDLDDDPEDASPLIWYALHALNVSVHTVFIWTLALPLVVAVVAYQDYYQATTSVQRLLTLTIFRQDPAAFAVYAFESFLKNILLFCMVWIMFCYVKLIIYYTLTKYEKTKWRAVIRTLFWLYLTVMIALLVAYLFEVVCWLILGAVVNPNKYLPYSVATITLLVHTQATYMRLQKKFTGHMERVKSVVSEAFQSKLRAAMDVVRKAQAQAKDALTQAQAQAKDAMAQAQSQATGAMQGLGDNMAGAYDRAQGAIPSAGGAGDPLRASVASQSALGQTTLSGGGAPGVGSPGGGNGQPPAGNGNGRGNGQAVAEGVEFTRVRPFSPVAAPRVGGSMHMGPRPLGEGVEDDLALMLPPASAWSPMPAGGRQQLRAAAACYSSRPGTLEIVPAGGASGSFTSSMLRPGSASHQRPGTASAPRPNSAAQQQRRAAAGPQRPMSSTARFVRMSQQVTYDAAGRARPRQPPKERRRPAKPQVPEQPAPLVLSPYDFYAQLDPSEPLLPSAGRSLRASRTASFFTRSSRFRTGPGPLGEGTEDAPGPSHGGPQPSGGSLLSKIPGTAQSKGYSKLPGQDEAEGKGASNNTSNGNAQGGHQQGSGGDGSGDASKSGAAVVDVAGAAGGKLEPYQIFKMYCNEKEGLDYKGFCKLLDHLEIQLIGDKRRELFAKYDLNNDKFMYYREFEDCYDLIQLMIVEKSMIEAGMTRGRLIVLLLYAILVLMLVFIFIFVGVAAFTGTGTVGAVVNSLMAAGSGVALNVKKENNGEAEEVTSVKVGEEVYTSAGPSAPGAAPPPPAPGTAAPAAPAAAAATV